MQANSSRNDENNTPRKVGVLKRGHDHLSSSSPRNRAPFAQSPAANKSVTLSKAVLQKSVPCSPSLAAGVISSPATPSNATPSKGCEENNIKVFIRTRPLSPDIGSCVVLDTTSSTISLGDPKARKAGKAPAGGAEDFKFEDGVLPPEISQEEFFEAVGTPAACSVLDGFNVTIFAYGQTGSGKTHSVYGSGGRPDVDQAAADMGLAGRVVHYLIRAGKGLASTTEGVSYRYSLSLVDVYDEKVTDLFDGKVKEVREGGKKGKEKVYVEGAVWKAIGSASQAYEYLLQGLRGRHVAYTKLNSHSSRSHTICMLKVSKDHEEEGVVRNCTAVMTIVDLCGSERVKKSDVEGTRLKEAININQSLSALKTVIEALANAHPYVNYRSSKLTWLLRECIGGNAKVALIAHVNPDPAHMDESKSTLRFVTVVKTVKTKSRRVERVKSEEEILQDLAMREAEEDERRRLGFEEEEEAILPPPPPSTQDWGGGTELSVAHVETQVSPGRFGGGVEHLEESLRRLGELRSAGALQEDEYRAARAKAIAEWLPPPKEGELPPGHALLQMKEEVWSEEEDEEEEAGEGGPAKRARKEEEAKRTQGVTLRIQGPGATDQLKLLVRLSASFKAARNAFFSVHKELAAASVTFWLRDQEVTEETSVADLQLQDGDAIVVRTAS